MIMADDQLKSQLLAAIRQHDLAACQQALDAGVEPNATCSTAERTDERSLLVFSIVQDFTAGALLLLERGANPCATSTGIAPPLLVAARRGDHAVCRSLIAHGARVNEPDRDDRTPLHAAASELRLDVCLLLLTAGAHVDAWRPQYGTPLHAVVTDPNPLAADIIRLLMAHGADPNYMPAHDVLKTYLTPFQTAVSQGLSRNTACFLELGVNPDQLTCSGKTMPQLAGSQKTGDLIRAALTERTILSEIGEPLDILEPHNPASAPKVFSPL
jgi:ankyrin repeat protein